MNKTFVVDAAERIAATYIESVLGLVTTNMTSLTSLNTWQTAAVAAIPAALAAIKTLVAGMIPGTVSPASMVPEQSTPFGL
jgi:Putative lactococcus lactis phage r1t holin